MLENPCLCCDDPGRFDFERACPKSGVPGRCEKYKKYEEEIEITRKKLNIDWCKDCKYFDDSNWLDKSSRMGKCTETKQYKSQNNKKCLFFEKKVVDK